ncbi:MAG TPA: hypothetical protein VMV37_04840 [Gammaproteobacteria bacterium]|nr:hypothetical protein [Gammaproteobacteria bacterium]
MKAVARLMLTYFTGTRLLTVLTVLGIVGIVSGTYVALYVPLVAQIGLPSRFSLAEEMVLSMLPVAGLLCFIFGAALLPSVFMQLATGHYAYVLPNGRVKLLASAFGTVTLVALIVSATISLFYQKAGFSLERMFERGFCVSILSYTILYGVLWFIGRSNSIGKLVGTAAAIATIVLPLRFMIPGTPFPSGLTIACATLWTALAAGVLLAPRLKLVYGRARHGLAERFGGASYRGGGREIDFMLNTANPWPLAVGQIAPIAIAAYYLRDYHPLAAEAPPNPLLFFMTILSVVSGGMTSVAATRARALWLRAHWTRTELFARVERAFWGHNSFVLGVLLVMLVAVGSWLELPTRMLVFGLGLLMLGTALSTYLGLLVTASIGWLECVLGGGTMLALMMASTYTASQTTPATTIVAIHAGLAAAVLAFRQLAARRWARLDWMLCRADSTVRGAT